MGQLGPDACAGRSELRLCRRPRLLRHPRGRLGDQGGDLAVEGLVVAENGEQEPEGVVVLDLEGVAGSEEGLLLSIAGLSPEQRREGVLQGLHGTTSASICRYSPCHRDSSIREPNGSSSRARWIGIRSRLIASATRSATSGKFSVRPPRCSISLRSSEALYMSNFVSSPQ